MQKYTTIDAFLGDLDQDKRQQVDALRNLIFKIEPALQEHIKWNAPSYVLEGGDRITFNLMNKQNLVKVILHMGATRKEDKKAPPVMQDDSGLIEWNSNIRGTITFTDLEYIASKRVALEAIVSKWLSIPADSEPYT